MTIFPAFFEACQLGLSHPCQAQSHREMAWPARLFGILVATRGGAGQSVAAKSVTVPLMSPFP